MKKLERYLVSTPLKQYKQQRSPDLCKLSVSQHQCKGCYVMFCSEDTDGHVKDVTL